MKFNVLNGAEFLELKVELFEADGLVNISNIQASLLVEPVSWT
jgi:hypothetical protein